MLFINGMYCTHGPARSNPAYQYYDVPDVVPFLRDGDNTIAVLVLYCGYGTGQSMDRIPALFVDAELQLVDGSSIAVRSDADWLCRLCDAFDGNAPRVNGCKGPCQIFDNRRYDENWVGTDFDDSDWSRCHARDVNHTSPFFNLLRRPTPQLMETRVQTEGVAYTGRGKSVEPTDQKHLHLSMKKECATMQVRPCGLQKLPVCFPEHDRGEYGMVCLDFGQITTGYLNLVLSGHGGDICDLVFAETPLPDGRPYIEGTSYRPIARFVLREGVNHLRMFFNYDAMRFAYLLFRGTEGTVQEAWIQSVFCPSERESVFQTSDKAMQKLWDISVHTMHLSTLDAFVDSPSREQQQWMGDARFQALFHGYLNGDMKMLRKILYQFAQSQDFEGMTCSRYPDENYNWAPIPSYCLQWIGAFWDYYSFTGDLTPAYDLYDHMIRAMRWFTAFRYGDELFSENPYWLYYDMGVSDSGRPGDFQDRYSCAPDNLMLLEAAGIMEKFAVLLHDQEAEVFYHDDRKRLAEAIRRYFWSDEKGCMIDSIDENHGQSSSVSEYVNALALLHLFEPGSKEARSILRQVFLPETRMKDLVHVSVYSVPLYLRALVRHGQSFLACSEILKRYAAMLDPASQATSTWEDWNLIRTFPDGHSVILCSSCHGWGASGILLVAEALCGLSYEAGHPVLNEIGGKLEEIEDFSTALELPGPVSSKGFRLTCTLWNGQLTRHLEELV